MSCPEDRMSAPGVPGPQQPPICGAALRHKSLEKHQSQLPNRKQPQFLLSKRRSRRLQVLSPAFQGFDDHRTEATPHLWWSAHLKEGVNQRNQGCTHPGKKPKLPCYTTATLRVKFSSCYSNRGRHEAYPNIVMAIMLE